jgi:hypothetical protein
MATDRIAEIVVRFENAEGTEVLIRTYTVIPDTAYIKANNPQGKVPGYVEVKGNVLKVTDRSQG